MKIRKGNIQWLFVNDIENIYNKIHETKNITVGLL